MAMTEARLRELALKGLRAELIELEASIQDIGIEHQTTDELLSPRKKWQRSLNRNGKGKGRLSAAGRAKISAMMKARWAAKRKAKKA